LAPANIYGSVRKSVSKSVSHSVSHSFIQVVSHPVRRVSHAQRADFTALGVAFLTHWLHLLTHGCTVLPLTRSLTYAGIFNGCKDMFVSRWVSFPSMCVCWYSHWLYLLCKWRRLPTIFPSPFLAHFIPFTYGV